MEAIFKLYQLLDPNMLRRRFLNQVGLFPLSILFGNDLESQLVSHGMWLERQHINMRIVATWFYPKDGKQRKPLCQDGKTDEHGKRLKKKTDEKRILMVLLGLIPLSSEAQHYSSPLCHSCLCEFN